MKQKVDKKQEKLTKTKAGSLKRLKNTDKLLARLVNSETDIKKLMKRYFEQCYGNKISDLNKMDNFLEKH